MTPVSFLAVASPALGSVAIWLTLRQGLDWFDGVLIFYGGLALAEFAYLAASLASSAASPDKGDAGTSSMEPSHRTVYQAR